MKSLFYIISTAIVSSLLLSGSSFATENKYVFKAGHASLQEQS